MERNEQNTGWLQPRGESQGLKCQVGISGMRGNDQSRITVMEASRTGRIFGSFTRTSETYRLNQRGQRATLGEGNI